MARPEDMVKIWRALSMIGYSLGGLKHCYTQEESRDQTQVLNYLAFLAKTHLKCYLGPMTLFKSYILTTNQPYATAWVHAFNRWRSEIHYSHHKFCFATRRSMWHLRISGLGNHAIMPTLLCQRELGVDTTLRFHLNIMRHGAY